MGEGDRVGLLSQGAASADAGDAGDDEQGDLPRGLEMGRLRKPSKPVSVMQAFVSSSMPSGVLGENGGLRRTRQYQNQKLF